MLLAAGSARAAIEDLGPKTDPGPPPPGLVLRVSGCPDLVPHVPDAGVAYTPGVDARGNAVAPADLGGNDWSHITAAVAHDIVIRIDLADRLGLGDDGTYEGLLPVGNVSVNERGEVLFNGRVLVPEDARAVRTACREGARVVLPTAKPADPAASAD